MNRRARDRGGFTLIEVVIALAIGAVLLTTVMSVMVVTLRDTKRARAHSEMLRDADFVSHALNTELRLAGLGVPLGAHVAVTPGTCAGGAGAGNVCTSAPSPQCPAPGLCSAVGTYGTPPRAVGFYAALLVGGTNQIGILADLPRPDANYGVFGALHTRATGGPTAVAWHNENNGACMPDNNAATCVAGRDSVFFADDLAGCVTTGGGAAFTDRKCPWGMRRLMPGESIQIVAGDGSWSDAVVSGSVQRVAAGVPVVSVSSAVLSTGFSATAWPNLLPGQGPGGVPGQGFVTTLDRVFYRVVGTNIVRRQCWGDPDPNQANWPNGATNTVPTATPQLSGGSGVSVNTCTDEEVVARNVSGLNFTYRDAAGATVAVTNAATKASVRRVDYTIDFAKTIDGRPVTHTINGTVRLSSLP